MGREIRKVLFNQEAREKLKRGVDLIANAVKVTLGPKGRNVAIGEYHHNKFPRVTKDGVTVAKEVATRDLIENMGVQMVREVAMKTVEDAGDGTTTSCVLTQAIFNHSLKFIENGANSIEIKRGIDRAVQEVVKYLKKLSKPIKVNSEHIYHIAKISANNDTEIADLIVDALVQTGDGGLITFDESKDSRTYVEIIKGAHFERGYISPYFYTDPERLICEYEKPLMLFTDNKLSNLNELLPLLEKVYQTKRPFVIFCDDMEGEVLSALIINKMRMGFKVVGIRAPEYAERRRNYLEDMAIMFGGRYVSTEFKGDRLEDVTLDDLGTCEKIVVRKDECLLMGTTGDPEKIKQRIEELKTFIEETDDNYLREKAKDRLGKMSGGIAIIRAGGNSEVEMKEKKDRIEDAVSSVRSALEEGILPGGGTALIRAISVLDKLKLKNEDQMLGVQIIKKALEEPLRQICRNGGVDDGVVVGKVKNTKQKWFGYNAYEDKFGNLYKMGIVDSTKVVRCALENAASVASMLLTTECVISHTEYSYKDGFDELKREIRDEIRHAIERYNREKEEEGEEY